MGRYVPFYVALARLLLALFLLYLAAITSDQDSWRAPLAHSTISPIPSYRTWNSPNDRPNIIFILADDLGYTDLGCQGSRYYESPNIDRLASQSLRFTNAYSSGPNCQPTRAALMTGQYGPRTGVFTVGSSEQPKMPNRLLHPVENSTVIPLGKMVIPQALHEAGYVSASFGK